VQRQKSGDDVRRLLEKDRLQLVQLQPCALRTVEVHGGETEVDEVVFYGIGKDHLQNYSPKAGCYYKEDEKQTLEEYETASFLEDAKRAQAELHKQASQHMHIPHKDEAATTQS